MLDRRALLLAIASLLVAGLVAGSVPAAVHAQRLEGMVSNESAALPLPGVTVTLMTTGLESLGTTTTNLVGTFQFALPGPGTYHLSIHAPGFASVLSDELVVESGQSVQLVFALRPVDPGSPGIRASSGRSVDPDGAVSSVFGRVVEYESGRPIEGARVDIGEGAQIARTDSNGYFALTDLRPGIHPLEISHLGLQTRRDVMLFEGGRAYQIEATLSADPIVLEGLRVQVRSRAVVRALAEVMFRMGHNKHLGGIYFTRRDLDLRGNQPMSEILRSLVSVKIVKLNSAEYLVGLRGRRFCGSMPTMFVDGVKVATGKEPLDLNMIPTMDIEIVEIYKSAASMPAEFGGSDGQCGAIAIWTRRGG